MIILLLASIVAWILANWEIKYAITKGSIYYKTALALWVTTGITCFIMANSMVMFFLIDMHKLSIWEMGIVNAFALLCIIGFLIGLKISSQKKYPWALVLGFNYAFSLADEINEVLLRGYGPDLNAVVFDNPEKFGAGVVLFMTTMLGFALFTLAAGRHNPDVKAPSKEER